MKDAKRAPVGLATGMICAVLIANSTPVEAAELRDGQAKKMFSTYGCNACHAPNETRIGPAYIDVARLYQDADETVVTRLSLKIRRGGGGVWGITPMVSNPDVTQTDATALVRWILLLDDRAEQPERP